MAEELSVVTEVSVDGTRMDVVTTLEVVFALERNIVENEDRRTVELDVTTSMTAVSVGATSSAMSSLIGPAYSGVGMESAVDGSDCSSRSEPGSRAAVGISEARARPARSRYKSHEALILTRCSCCKY